MARRLIERHFNPAIEILVRRPFTGSGRHYTPGDAFPWRQLAVNQRRVRQLFDSGYLYHPEQEPNGPTKEQGPAASPSPEPPKAETSAPSGPASIPEPEPTPEVPVEPEPDELDAIDSMKELRAIAEAEGATFKASKIDQRQAIRDNR